MKKTALYLFLTICGGIYASCDNDTYSEAGTKDPNATVTTDISAINASADAATYTINVNTTFSEWNAYSNDSWIKLHNTNTGNSNGTIDVILADNYTSRTLEGSVIIMSGTTRLSIPVTQAASSTPIEGPDGYEIVWHDEFDTGNQPNAEDWTHEVKPAGWVNSELQNYVDHRSPAGKAVTEIKDGKLRINCFKEDSNIYSGRIYAHVDEGWQFGYIEASIKLPKGKGTWPAFWMMPVNYTGWPDSGEIDIMEEVGGHANYVSSSLHANAHVHTNGTQVTHEMYLEGAEDAFHTYAIKWTADNITTYVDGQVQLSYDNRGLGHDDWPYNAPFYVILNLAWGGSWGGMYGIDEAALPVTMEVDYVRVFQKK